MTFSAIDIAQLAACLALVLCLYALGQALASVRLHSPARLVSARHAMLAVFGLLSLAGALLIRAFMTADFGVAYVAQNSNLELPLLYKFAATWGAHEGSLLLWSWYLALMTALALVIYWRDHPLSMPWIIATLAVVQIGFLALIVFLSNPFATLLPVPDNGRDLNPLLQDPGLAFHPPVLYLGYVGFAVPFAFGIAALIRRHVGIEWVTAVRRWVLFAWTMLTTGIIFGGYWAWDPVENASLMPWLTGTALLHSMMAQEKRQMFRLWNMFLVISTFLLTLLGTFLVRSGVLTSVHSFASDAARGTYILIFLGLAMLAGYGLLIWRAETLDSDAAVESPFSREAGLLANNVLLLIAAATVVIGTLFPLAVEVITGDKISVGALYFNVVIVPIMVGLMFLMALGPSVPWRRMGTARFARQFAWPLALGGATVAVALWAGVVRPLSLAAILAVGFAALEDLRRGVAARMRVTGEWVPRATLSVLRRGRRRIGGLIVHLGIVILAAGMIGSGLFQEACTGVYQTSCPPMSCGISDFRGADFGFGVEPDGPGGLPVAGIA